MNKKYNSKRWKTFREKIKRRDGYICKYYKRYGKTLPADLVHHIFPVDKYPELFFCPYNLISLSTKAHELMHDRVTGELTFEGKKLQEKYKDKIFAWLEERQK